MQELEKILEEIELEKKRVHYLLIVQTNMR